MLATVTAPAFAASPVPLTIVQAPPPGSSGKLVLNFSHAGGGPAAVNSILVSKPGAGGTLTPIAGSPASFGSLPGTWTSSAQQSIPAGTSIFVSYTFNGAPFTQEVVTTITL